MRKLLIATLLLLAPVAILASSAHDSNAPLPTLSVPEPPKAIEKRLHPAIQLLDRDGTPVLESGAPVSTMKTCGGCHDTEYIDSHGYHSTAGMGEEPRSGRPWDFGTALYGRWNPMLYRRLSVTPGDDVDLGLPDWIRMYGTWHVGGGPAMYTEDGTPLEELEYTPGDPRVEAWGTVVDSTGRVIREKQAWDWKKSGTVEMNCFLCHIKNPDNGARVGELAAGRFKWANTATLAGTGLVSREGKEWKWNPDAFDASNRVPPEKLRISDPSSANCGLCHGKAYEGEAPLVFRMTLENIHTETTGQVFSSQKIFNSGMNVQGKKDLGMPWDVHAERLLECSNCHYSMNNPAFIQKESDFERPDHLKFDSRRLEINDYLLRPDHNFAKGHTSQGNVAEHMDGSMRDCQDCHDAEKKHDFLPYKKLHFEKVNCQTCHIKKIYAPARESTDWTVLDTDGAPAVRYRGVEGDVNDPASFITGYEPVLLIHEETNGKVRLGPHNLISSWFWVQGEEGIPVNYEDLKKAFIVSYPHSIYSAVAPEPDKLHPDIVKALDTDGDGKVSAAELRLDTDAKVAAVKARLEAVGVKNPRIKGEVQPYTLSHSTQTAEYAVQCCSCCHSDQSKIIADFELAGYVPGGVIPEPVVDGATQMPGEFEIREDGRLFFKPNADPNLFYIHGVNRVKWIDTLGIMLLLVALAGVTVHGVLRVLSARSRKGGE